MLFFFCNIAGGLLGLNDVQWEFVHKQCERFIFILFRRGVSVTARTSPSRKRSRSQRSQFTPLRLLSTSTHHFLFFFSLPPSFSSLFFFIPRQNSAPLPHSRSALLSYRSKKIKKRKESSRTSHGFCRSSASVSDIVIRIWND